MPPRVTAIIPTLADRTRRETLTRAIWSLRSASAGAVRILLVVNGNRFDPETVEAAGRTPGVELCQVERGSLPYAIETGRSMVRTPFFCFLDDDDEYLPGAIDQRLAMLDADASLDFVATNGLRESAGEESEALESLDAAIQDPLRALFNSNWLASCGGMFRTDRIGKDIFRQINPYTEWTWIAFRLAREGKRLGVSEVPGFRIHETAGSASKSDTYRRAFLPMYRRMLESGLPRELQRLVKARISDTLHDLSDMERRNGNAGAAWRLHLASLASVRGLRYLPYTCRLLLR